MWDVIVAGAGPAGSVAATILARAGARVLLLDRERFPRDKLCGDSLNPGTVAALRRLHPATWASVPALPIDGMVVTGPSGVRVESRYPRGLRGWAIVRRDLDRWLLHEAMRAGAQFEERVRVRGAIVGASGARGGPRVAGVTVASRAGHDVPIRAHVTVAADGRRSALAAHLKLASPASRYARWAVGGYFENVGGVSTLGEMHIRSGRYLGVAPLAGGLTNACVVASSAALREAGSPQRALRLALDADPDLRERFAGARLVAGPVALGPLGVDVSAAGAPGLLLAGDAAGFIDPMTGDGLRFAVDGARLAAGVALEGLAHDLPLEHFELARRRRTAFAWKWRFNRTLRALVDRPAAVAGAAQCASRVPSVVRALVALAGDCRSADEQRSPSDA